MKELMEKIEELLFKVREFKGRVDLNSKQSEIKSLEGEMSQPDFWSNQERARWISQTVADLKEEIKGWREMEGELESVLEIAREDEQDQSVNLRKEIEDKYYDLKRQFNKLETATVLNGKYDGHHAVLSIYAGAGGADGIVAAALQEQAGRLQDVLLILHHQDADLLGGVGHALILC